MHVIHVTRAAPKCRPDCMHAEFPLETNHHEDMSDNIYCCCVQVEVVAALTVVYACLLVTVTACSSLT